MTMASNYMDPDWDHGSKLAQEKQQFPKQIPRNVNDSAQLSELQHIIRVDGLILPLLPDTPQQHM